MDAPPCFLTKGAIAGALAGLVVMVFIDCAKTGWRFARSVAARSLSHLLDCEDLSKSALLSPKQLEKLSPKISPAVLEHDELEELCSVCLAELGHDDGEGWSLSAPSSNTSRKCCGGGGGGVGGARAKTLRRPRAGPAPSAGPRPPPRRRPVVLHRELPRLPGGASGAASTVDRLQYIFIHLGQMCGQITALAIVSSERTLAFSVRLSSTVSLVGHREHN